MKGKRKWVIGAGILAVTIAGLLFWLLGAAKVDRPQFRTAMVRNGSIRSTVTSTGVLMPLNTVEVGSQVSGIIKTIYVDDNSFVKENQILAIIDDALYADQVAQAQALVKMAVNNHQESISAVGSAKASLKSAQGQLFAARATFEDAKRNHDRLITLFNKGIVSDSVLDAAVARRDNAKGNLDMAQAHFESAKIQLERAILKEQYAELQIAERKANLSLAKTKLSYCTIRSPIDGMVILKSAEQGQTVAATFQAPVLFIIAQDLTHMKVEIDVSEADIGRIRSDQSVEFTVDAFPEHTFTAMVSQIKNSATNIHNVVTYKVIAETKNAQLRLRPGMTANASILLATVDDALLIPNAALRYKPPKSELADQKIKLRQQYAKLYKKIVKGLELNSQQADVLKESFTRAAQNLKNSYASSDKDQDRKAMEQLFIRHVFTSLRPVLNTDQLIKLKLFRSRVQEMEKKGYQQTTVYVQDQGRLKPVRTVIGISDETFTQVISGDLALGDLVIIGNLKAGSDPGKSRSTGLFRFKG